MEDRNKTVAQLIADLQNELDKANNRIDELAEENNKLTCDNILLKEDNLIVNNRIEVLLKENKELKDNNDIQFRNLHRLRQDINEYAKDLDKEKRKHQRATEKITQLKEESNALYDMIDYLYDRLKESNHKSKSKLYMRYGNWLMEGLAIGIKRGVGKATEASENAANKNGGKHAKN